MKKPYEQMDDLGGFPPIFGSTPIYIYIHLPPSKHADGWIFPEGPKLQYDLSIQAPQGQPKKRRSPLSVA